MIGKKFYNDMKSQLSLDFSGKGELTFKNIS